MPELERFVEDFVIAIRDDSAAVFAGAGLSIPAGLVDWRTLMRDIAADVNLDVDRETDLVSVAQYHVNERGGRHRINEALVTEFAERAELSENHRLLTELPIRTYWTTNYDNLIETALRGSNKRVDVKHTDVNLAYTLRQRDAVLYKMHGDVSQPDDAVVTRDDYELYSIKRPLMASALQGDLVSKTFLFVGFSFNDPNLSYVLGRIRVLLGGNRREHYCLFRRVQRADFPNEDEYNYAIVRQDLQVKDLRRYGIQTVLIDSYEEYTAVLQKISARFKRSRIFVSGSGETLAPFTDAEGQELIRQVGKGIIEAGFDLVNGFGLGVGPFLLNGALEGLGDTGSSALNDRLVLRPFPQGIADPNERAARWTRYREGMISQAGIAVFLFGNKRTANGDVVIADGVMEEFELARASGLAIVPVGVTRHAAAQIYQRIVADFGSYYPNGPDVRTQFERLASETDVTTIVNQLLEIIDILRGA